MSIFTKEYERYGEKRTKLSPFSWLLILGLPVVLFVLFLASAMGGHTLTYDCKYIDSVKVLVPDHEKYASASYQIKYDDGTTGVVANTDLEMNSPEKGVECRTIFQWGFPYSWANRSVSSDSIVKGE